MLLISYTNISEPIKANEFFLLLINVRERQMYYIIRHAPRAHKY